MNASTDLKKEFILTIKECIVEWNPSRLDMASHLTSRKLNRRFENDKLRQKIYYKLYESLLIPYGGQIPYGFNHPLWSVGLLLLRHEPL